MRIKAIAVVVALSSSLFLAGCDTPAQTVALGAAAGAGVAAATGGSVAAGALIGGGVGLACEATGTCT